MCVTLNNYKVKLIKYFFNFNVIKVTDTQLFMI